MPISKLGTSIISSNLQNCILGPGADGQVPSSRFMASIRFVDDQYIQHLEKNQAGKVGEKFSPTEIHHSHKISDQSIEIKGAHPCTSSSGQGGGKRVLEDFFKNPTTQLRVVWGLTEKKCEQTPKFACFSV